MSDSSFEHEREALAFLRRALPDHDCVRVWSNFEFVARNGSMYEVDALILTMSGLYLVEIKSYPGQIAGDAATWVWSPEPGKRLQRDAPRPLANRKAKMLDELLARSDVFRKARKRTPFLQEVIFLSDPNLSVQLNQQGKFHVYGRDAEDGEEIPKQRRSIGGIVEELTKLDPGRDGRPKRRIDRPTAELVSRAMNEIGVRERLERRTVGDWLVGRLLDDVDADRDTGVTYQDFEATHRAMPDIRRRVRIYPHEHNTDEQERQTAVRAARREFQLLHQLDIEGVLRPLDFTETDRGPALVFEFDENEEPLHRWLERSEVADKLRVYDRLNVLREIAETMLRTHQRGVTHRALSPTSVLVSGPFDQPRIRIANWHTAARVSQSTTGALASTGTTHAESLSAHDAALYRAPEFGLERANPVLADVFSLGALATLIFTGRPPAESLLGLAELMADSGHVPAAALSSEGLSDELAEVIEFATKADPSARIEDIPVFLEFLAIAEELWTLPDAPDERAPDEARKGDLLADGRFEVKNRLGKGSTAIALLVIDHEIGREVVLKAALDPAKNERLEFEALAIAELHHPNIVQLLDGPLDLQGHATLVLSRAGKSTLASRLAGHQLEELAERFGRDLLEAVRHLEERGIAHRDIKPENIGVAMMGKNEELRLVLYDFSLTEADFDQIGAGTVGYIDPFLKLPGRQRWDPHAERYSVAVTLYEMLTGTKPRYGDGSAEPTTISDGPTVVPSDFAPSVAAGLVEFFTTVLAREVEDRFDTADEMLRAWLRAFEPASQLATPPQPNELESEDADQEFMVPAGTSRATLLAALPLSNRAVNAMERSDVLSVGAMLDFPRSRLSKLPAVGAKTRRELVAAVAKLSDELENGDEPEAGAASEIPSSLSEIAGQLVPVERGNDAGSTTEGLGRLLGTIDGSSMWPTHTAVAESLDVTRARVSQIVAKARTRWLKQAAMTPVRDWVADELAAVGGLVTAEQLAVRLAQRVPDADSSVADHTLAARAVVRAALDAETSLDNPRWLLRRRQAGAVAVALEATEPVMASAVSLADYAVALAEATETAVNAQPVVSRPQFVDALAAVNAPEGTSPIAEAHLAELATSLSETAAMNARLELYRVGLAAQEAIRESRRAFVASRKLTEAEVIAKVRARFPQAEVLPPRPDLDALIENAGIALAWSEQEGAYLSQDPMSTSASATSIHREETAHGQLSNPVTPVETDEAVDFEQRILRQHNNGGLFLAVTERRRLERVVRELERFDVTSIDLDAVIMNRLAAVTANGQPSMEMLFEADRGGPGGAQWVNLQRVLDSVFVDLTADLLARPGTVVLHRLGLLARYERVGFLTDLREALHESEYAVRAVWAVTVSADIAGTPMIDGTVVPVLDHEWARVPRRWLENAHRADAQGDGS